MSNYLKLFDKINEIILDRYILFEEKNINWKEVIKKYSYLIDNISSDDNFVNLINNMLVELKDPHTRFTNIGNIPRYFLPVALKFVENCLVSTTEVPSIPKGAQLLEINKFKVSDFLETNKLNASTKMCFLESIYGNLEEESTYKYLWEGKIFNITLKNIYIQEKSTKSQKIFPKEIFTGIFSRKINDKTGYIKITSFNHGVSKVIFEKLKEYNIKEKLIIDLRGAQGGYIEETINSVSLFLDKSLYLGKKVNKINGEKNVKNIIITPIGNNLKFEKILVLVDNFTMSSAEFIFLRAVSKCKNVTIIGEKTAGIVHGTNRFVINKNYLLNLTTCKYYDEKGDLLKSVGAVPDIIISETLDDIKNSVDYVLDFAQRY